MSSPSAFRPDRSGSAASSDPGVGFSAAPAGAVSLADLVAETGPLPIDAALECVERLAERLSRGVDCSCEPADVLLDDDGEVWARTGTGTGDARTADAGGSPCGMEPLGRLLVFLVEGRADAVDPAALPQPVAGIAGRLFSKNGAAFPDYVAVTRAVRTVRGLPAPPDAEPDDAPEAEARPEPAALIAPTASPKQSEPAPPADGFSPVVESIPGAEPLSAGAAEESAGTAALPEGRPASGGIVWLVVGAAAAAAAAAWTVLH